MHTRHLLRTLFIAGTLFVCNQTLAQAPSYREGTWVIEPVVGFMTWGSPEVDFGEGNEEYKVYGGRFQHHRSYRTSILGEVLVRPPDRSSL